MGETTVYLKQNATEAFRPQSLVTLMLAAQLTENGVQALSPDVWQGLELALAIIIGLLVVLICANAAVKHKEVHDENRRFENRKS